MTTHPDPNADSARDPLGGAQQRLAAQVKSLRAAAGWSLQQLAEQCGVSTSMLSQIERAQVNPTVGVALAVSTALGVSLDDLLETGRPRPRVHVLRHGDPQYIYRSDEMCTIRTLSTLRADRVIEFYEVTLKPGGELRSAPHFRKTIEHLSVSAGAVRVECGDTTVDLEKGDSIEYPADVDHAIINRRRLNAVVYLIDSGPSTNA